MVGTDIGVIGRRRASWRDRRPGFRCPTNRARMVGPATMHAGHSLRPRSSKNGFCTSSLPCPDQFTSIHRSFYSSHGAAAGRRSFSPYGISGRRSQFITGNDRSGTCFGEAKCYLSGQRETSGKARHSCGSLNRSTTLDKSDRSVSPKCSTHHRTKQLRILAIKAGHLHLLDRVVVRRARVDLDPIGRSISSSRFLRLVACRMMFSRVRSSPHCFRTCTNVCDTT
jgi:hypothetical protein